MDLVIEPRDGVAPIVAAINHARSSLDILIFRFDRAEVQRAIEAAIRRGVRVRALIAHTNHGGGKRLRKLEQQLLDVGATVARTGNDFVRYHGKLIVIDGGALWVLGFNLTALDIARSRSFGVLTRRQAEVHEALRLFEADTKRQPYAPTVRQRLIVSPENARKALSRFITRASRQLLIYDPKVSDREMLKLLRERREAGIDVRIIGKVGKHGGGNLRSEPYPDKRLHVRAIVRDQRQAFVGSQSLRTIELDERREVGIIVSNPQIVAELVRTFEEDWALTASGKKRRRKAAA